MNNSFGVIWKITNYCNFACKYCHYSDEMHMKPGTMDLKLAELFIKNISDSINYKNITFMFHGGEPLLVGLDYYEEIVHFQKKYLKRKSYTNSFQTNGSLINKELINFIKKNNFSLSISLDGPKKINDSNRIYKNGSGSFDTIINGLNILNSKKQKFNILVVYCDLMIDSREMYFFFKELNGLITLDFLPMRANHETPFQVNYGYFLINLFNLWFNDPKCQFDIRILSSIIHSLLGLTPNLCVLRGSCITNSHLFSLDPYGNVYPCDNDTYSNVLLGNIQTNKIDDLFGNHSVRRKLSNFEIKKYQACHFCEWYPHCHGGCPDHYDVSKKQNAYCEDYKKIFKHIRGTLEEHSILNNYRETNPENINKIPNKNLVNTIKKHPLYNHLEKLNKKS